MIAIERRRVLFKASTVVGTLEIMGVTNISAETCQYVAIYNKSLDVTSSATWSIISGSSCATIGANNGQVTVFSNANENPVTIQAEYMGVIMTKEVFLTYVNGASSETETEIIVDGDGNTTTTTTTITTNGDGSSTESTSTIIVDESGNTLGTSESEVVTNSDGSYNGTTTNYDENGNPTDTENITGDTEGNVSSQSIEYDEGGNAVVTGYEIDTSNNTGGTKTFNADGVNTEYYAFDLTHGFVLDFDFTIDFSNQPLDQNQNHHNILTMKRATPEPWYGFQLRQSSTNKYIQLGTQFSGTSNTNTTINPQLTGNTANYSLKIVYDPTATANTFVCTDMRTNTIIYTSDALFPDLEELRYLKVTIGYSMDGNGDPYRYSNIDVNNFSLRRLTNVDSPSVSCDGKFITLTCATEDSTIYYRLNEVGVYSTYSSPIRITANTIIETYAMVGQDKSETVKSNCVYNSGIDTPTITCVENNVSISCVTTSVTLYYRLNESGSYSAYTEPITITADTIVEAYAMLDIDKSETATQTCMYDNGIDTPTIDCDGQYVTINCETPSVDLYYRFNESGNYSAYTEAIEITATTVVEAYAMLNGESGHTAMETCVYVGAISEPVIACNGQYVTITCATVGATIYYSLDSGSYSAYTAPIEITADTLVQSYATYSGRMSTVAMQNCIYDPIHDYSQDYLTFKVVNGGTILWTAKSGTTKTISYSMDNGQTWSEITSTSAGTVINVNTGDKILFKGTNTAYATDKNHYSAFYEGTALYDVEGNIMSLIYGDNFIGQTAMTANWALSNLFNHSNAVNAENLIMPATTLMPNCYRATFANSPYLTLPPELPATTLAASGYSYMFDNCVSLSKAPELPAQTIATWCYVGMFHSDNGNHINYIKCLATNPATALTNNWVNGVESSGTFVKASNATWTTGANGIPNGWVVIDDGSIVVDAPTIACDGEHVTIACATNGASIYYRLNQEGSYSSYTTAITITADTIVQAYGEKQGTSSVTTTQNCEYLSSIPFEASNRNLNSWTYNNVVVTTPYSVNAIDGHSSAYNKGTFNFETSFTLREAQPTYLWFQHADQSASIYVDNTLVGKHWGGYTSFFYDISNNVHSGTNIVKVALKNNEGNNLAPAYGDFNFNATLGNVKLFTSPYVPDISYGYDGFHITSSFEYSDANNLVASAATINVKTSVPTGASVTCIVADSGGSTIYSATSASTNAEMTFTTPKITGANLHLWNGIISPYLYTITLEIRDVNDVLYHRYQRGYGLRYYEYLINDTTKIGTAGSPFTGFLLNGSHYLLRGCCMHDDLDGKANALNDADYAQEFSIIQELNLNFLRLAHYPHPKEVYDWCDRLGIIVQTEGPCVNKMQSTMPTVYFDNLTIQYTEMVQQHFNHPSILFWGLSNETTTDDKEFARVKIEGYASTIKAIDQERLVGYVMSASWDDPYGYYNSPAGIDWLGCNLYVGWYSDTNSNDPTTKINSRITKTVTNRGKALAYSEYGCGGTQRCHSDNFMDTTTRGNHERHDIEYMMWLHEGHIATIKQYPQLLFTAQWQLFDIAVANRNEGYTVCLDGENTSIDDELRRLNNKGLVERDHVTKKDTFYLYKAWWNPTPFVHICGKNYTKTVNRVIKCYTNQTTALTLKVNGTTVETATPTDNILTFTEYTFSAGDVVTVEGSGSVSDTFTFGT